ncbi:ubiquitin carboxyl-terminal hydrolase 32 [Neolamprologus brichardi]|uniref:ubiquitin carboxyl-terminal hydrolase 32 n=1 Tax=Neolamprologus brichardi TaxID=32507 RepID=UPI0016436BC8|nr:ubiquitin carboxyl-terminal hydrolase 32 [Neolamprologus brichardi]
MGAKESRIGFLSYDEAVKRVTDVELKRLKDAFKRTSGLSYYMTQQCFYREVLGDGVPPKVAEVIYTSFGGSAKGLHFNNLIVGLVLLTRGRDEEKAKYLFSLFASDLGGYAAREDIEAVLQVLDGEVPASLKESFGEGDKVNYDRFRNWLLQDKEAFTLSRWLLSGGVCVTLTDDSDTPTFYQTLAGVTHLEESDIIDLEKRYWLLKAQSRTGRFDLETFIPLVSPPIHASLSEGLFHAFDENRDNHIDFKEISCGLSACCRGPVAERQKCKAHCGFTSTQTPHISPTAAHNKPVSQLKLISRELQSSVSDIVEDILKMHDTTKLGHLSLEDYQIWSVKSALANEFLNLLFQVCHIVLGLRPFCSLSAALSPQVASATESCFARQHNVSDNNNQCFSGANGHLPSQLAAQRPGAIDNQPLVTTDPMKAPTLTMEGGRLKRSLQLLPRRDFETVPEPVWRALYHWYGANLSLPRPVILESKTGQPELELFPRYLLFLRQQPATRSPQSNIWVNMGNVPSPNAPLKRMLAYTGCFSRMGTIKDIHLYLSHLNTSLCPNSVPTEKGATGLSNLGNTCFMNSSIQCVSNTKPLTDYFLSGRHLYELNRTNPIGMRGHMAKCYGDLVMELWSGTQKNVAPLKLRWTIAKYAPRFNGFQQQDSQELLAFLLDGLHEDLNRVHEKPYVELKDSDGRPDWEVASEFLMRREPKSTKARLTFSQKHSDDRFWGNGLTRQQWNFLEVIKLDGSTPVRYGLRLNMDEKYTGLKKQLSELCSLKPEQILLAEVHSSNIKVFTPLWFRRAHSSHQESHGTCIIEACGLEPHFGRVVSLVCGNVAVGVEVVVALLDNIKGPSVADAVVGSCDDSMGYQYPFTLRVVGKDGNSCAWCPWYRFCRGCTIECTEDRAAVGNAYIAVDWDPTALHLRYQTSQERIVEEHCSVEQSRRAQAEPISLDSCLKAFTSEEELGEDELYYCSKCKTHRLATKKLDLWRLPPILIVHLKRFQFVNGRWIKSQKIVKFPRENFDPSAFLAPRDLEHRCLHSRSESEDLLRVGEDNLSSISAPAGFGNLPKASPASSRKSAPSLSRNSSPSGSPKAGSGGRRPGRLRLPQLGSRHRLSNSKENLDGAANSEAELRDDAPQCHSGILGGGHYVTYAKNPNGKWYCYNDSSCKEVHSEEIDTDSAYILFYEQQGVNYSQFLPKIDGKKMADTSSMDEDFESDYKKYCVLQ